jgi:3-deoxy-D-manno-octulosonate 8-phosphate phosphatase (KDO 8-P phosphatase)
VILLVTKILEFNLDNDMNYKVFNKVDKKIIEAIQNIELIVFDFDGVFTDNSVIIDQNGIESVRCSRSDGLGLRLLDKLMIEYCIISSESNPVVTTRANKLNIEVTQGHSNKLIILKKIISKKNYKLKNIAYVGNDINDIECLKVVGLPIAVCDSFPEVLTIAKYITIKLGGYGAVREVCDLFVEYHRNN